MRIPRIFVDMPLDGRDQVQLPREAERHVRTVLRRECGQQLVLFNGRGGEYLASIQSTAAGAVTVDLERWLEVDRELCPRVSLWQAICRGGRMDYVIEKSTELGVHEIMPLMSRRSVVRLDEKRARQRCEHWQGIARSASEQSGRTLVPRVHPPAWLPHDLSMPLHPARLLLLSPHTELTLRSHVMAGSQESRGAPLGLIVGPEGGFEPGEEKAMLDAGCTEVSLGPLTLRSDTAAVAALAVLRALDETTAPSSPAQRA